MTDICPLCNGPAIYLCTFKNRGYYQCDKCELAFVPAYQHLSEPEELKRYDLHNNSAESESYIKYLTQVAAYLSKIPVLDPVILDFGSYKTHVLSDILREKGYESYPYDPCYKVGLENLDRKYDIIIICEVIEHLGDIMKEINLLKRLLSPHTGYILIRTELYDTEKDIEKWWYTNDETHIFLPSEHTISVIGEYLCRDLVYSDGKRYLILGPSASS